ncbi:MAG: dihydroorotase family protein [Alphaproteobacteria bacterium]|nr:dihydroorotase family protein [Alphaproteobacteria bacterium]
MYDLLIEDATIVSPSGRQVADVAIEDGVIVYVGSRPFGRSRKKMSAIGKFLIPGLIDGHVSLSWDGDQLGEQWRRTSSQAAVGGVTTVLDVAYRGAPVTSASAYKKRRAAAQANSRVNFGIWALGTQRNANRLEALLDAGAVGVQLAMPFADADIDALLRSLGALGDAPLDVLPGQAPAPKAAFKPGSPSPEAAAEAIDVLIRTADALGRRAHVAQLSSAEELRRVDPLRRDLPITLGVSVHHLFLSTETTEDHPQAPLHGFPPLREESDRRSLWTALRRGRIDTVTSAHVGTAPPNGATPSPTPPGMPGLLNTLGLMRASIDHGRLGLERLVELVCARPAEVFGLKTKGRIQEGHDADFVLFSEERPGPCAAPAGGWSPFLGREIAPPPDMVFVGGELAAQAGKLVDDTPRGTQANRGR